MQMYNKYITEAQSTGRYRKLPEPLSDSYLDFSTNDYLSLSRNPEVLDAAINAAKEYGVGATGSRLLSGNKEIFEKFERRIALDKGTESAVIFNSGFQANISTLSSLLDVAVLKCKPIVFFDRLNHASLYQAISLSNPELVRYKHNDMQHLAELMDHYKDDERTKFIVAETIFGMDGTILPISEILHLASKHNAFLYLDEAHATGLVGARGYGLSTTVALSKVQHVVMGTFSKALGCSGGYVACSSEIKEYLVNKSRGFIYSTANSPMLIGAAFKAWEIVESLEQQRAQLFELSKSLRDKLKAKGFDIGDSNSHIIPIIIGEERRAMHVKEELQKRGIIVSCVRPPTVPANTSRIRIAMTTSHTSKDVDLLLKALEEICIS